MATDLGAELAVIGELSEPLRRNLYLFVVGEHRPVGRAEAAAAAGISRTLAAFHLDRLVEAGLLRASRGRTSDRRGPGSGRPAVLYQRASRPHELSIPPRHYAVAARMLVEAIDEAGADRLLFDAAEREGLCEGRALRSATAAAPSDDLDAVGVALQASGYEPRREGDELRLFNCPFHDLARSSPPLVCGMNLARLAGLVAGLGVEADVRLEPRPGDGCCVVISNDNLD
jgi:predicted ArsR family transcriptional regulator